MRAVGNVSGMRGMSIFRGQSITTLLAQATQSLHAATRAAIDPIVAPPTKPVEFGAGDVILALWLIAALVAIFRLVILRPKNVIGPQRASDAQQIGVLVISFALGFLTWLLTQAAYQSYVLAQLKRSGIADAQSHLEEYLKPHDLALLGTLPFIL